MNHSIHSADRATHLKIVVVALVAGIAVAGFRHLGPYQLGLQPDRPRHQGRQAGGRDQFGHIDRPLDAQIPSEVPSPSGGMECGRLSEAALLLLTAGLKRPSAGKLVRIQGVRR